MRIISKIKDYYDYVQHVYGEDDSKVIYERKEFESSDKEEFPSIYTINYVCVKISNDGGYFKPPFYHVKYKNYYKGVRDSFSGFRFLIVCGKRFLLIQDGDWDRYSGLDFTNIPYVLFNKEKHAHLIKESKFGSYFYKRDLDRINGYTFHNVFNQEFVEISKKINAPVFVVEYYGFPQGSKNKFVGIGKKVPNLGELGLASIYPAEQLYQDIDYFLTNTIKDSPDTMPPVSMTDKEKIESHGFDNKVSFRPTSRKE